MNKCPCGYRGPNKTIDYERGEGWVIELTDGRKGGWKKPDWAQKERVHAEAGYGRRPSHKHSLLVTWLSKTDSYRHIWKKP
jgi:hypothetical protein